MRYRWIKRNWNILLKTKDLPFGRSFLHKRDLSNGVEIPCGMWYYEFEMVAMFLQ